MDIQWTGTRDVQDKRDKMDLSWRRTVDISPMRYVTGLVHVQTFLTDLPNVNGHGTDMPNVKCVVNGH